MTLLNIVLKYKYKYSDMYLSASTSTFHDFHISYFLITQSFTFNYYYIE